MTTNRLKIAALSATVLVFVTIGPIMVKLSASDEVKGADGRNAKLEKWQFQAAPAHYKYPPAIPPSSPGATEEVSRPEFRGKRMLSAEFSWQIGPGYPRVAGLRVATAEEQGDEFDPGISNLTGMAENNDREYWANDVPVFPRRGKKVRLRLLTGEKLIAEFTIPNPAPGPHPMWTAQTLPAHETAGDLEVTLTGFRAFQPGQENKQRARTECVFNFREQNRETVAWRPAVLEVSDATGNHWRADANGATVENGSVRFEFAGALWPSESAWKLRGEFRRVSGFPENERLQLAKIRIPDAKEIYEPHVHYECNGADIELAGVIGEAVDGNLLSKEHRQLMNAERAGGCVSVALAGEVLSRNRRLTFVSATDDRGRIVELLGLGEPSNLSDVKAPVPYSFVLRPSGGARELNLVVAVSESRFIEFLAKPEQVYPDLVPLT